MHTGCLWAVPHPCARMGAMSTQQEPLRAKASATSATSLSYFNTHGVAKSLQAFQKGLWTEKLTVLETAFLTLPFEDVVLAKWEECQGDQDCPQDTGLCLPPLGTDTAGCTSGQEHTRYYLNSKSVFSPEGNNQIITSRSHIYSFQGDLQSARLDFLRCLVVKDPPG